MIAPCVFRIYFMFEIETSTIGDNNLLVQQKTIIRQYSKAILISGIFGIIYTIFSGFPYLGNYLLFGVEPNIAPISINRSPFISVALSSLAISYVFLGFSVFHLSKLYNKVYYPNQRRLFYRGLMYLYIAFTIFLVIIVIGITIAGDFSDTNNSTQQSPSSFIFAIILIYTMSTFPLAIFFVITSFALRTKNQYLILLAFIAAPDVYFLPIIAGFLGLFMISDRGNRALRFLYAVARRKIRRIELRILAIVYRVRYLDRQRYNKYVYPVLAFSILVTAILLYYSLTIKSFLIGGYKFYYHPYHFGPDNISNELFLVFLLFLDFLLIRYVVHSARSIKIIYNMSLLIGISLSAMSIAFILESQGNYSSLLDTYSQSIELPAYGFIFGSFLFRSTYLKNRKKGQMLEG